MLTSLVHCILVRLLNAFHQPLKHQMISIRIRQLKELNDPTTHVCDNDANVSKNDYMIICPNNCINGGTRE